MKAKEYRIVNKLCIDCGVKITPEYSKRLICLRCCLEWSPTKLLQDLLKLNLRCV